MDELRKAVKELAEYECERGIVNYGYNHSLHEGYAIYKEELEEMDAEIKTIHYIDGIIWERIKRDSKDATLEIVNEAERVLANALAEGIQTLAMLKKMKVSEE